MWTASCVSSVSMFASYLYDFPFLGDDSTITVDDNLIDPLYKHVFLPEVAPQLSFIWIAMEGQLCCKLLLISSDALLSGNLPSDPLIRYKPSASVPFRLFLFHCLNSKVSGFLKFYLDGSCFHLKKK